jgi:hypothetical protein
VNRISPFLVIGLVTRLPIHGASDSVGWAMMICQSGVRTHYLQSRRENRLETSASIEMAKHTLLSAESALPSHYTKKAVVRSISQ